jgi:hypothetical protein
MRDNRQKIIDQWNEAFEYCDPRAEELIKAWTTEEHALTDAQAVSLARFLLTCPDNLLPLGSMAPGLYWILAKFLAQNSPPKLRPEDISRIVDGYLSFGDSVGEARAAAAKLLKKTKEAVERADQRARNRSRQK